MRSQSRGNSRGSMRGNPNCDASHSLQRNSNNNNNNANQENFISSFKDEPLELQSLPVLKERIIEEYENNYKIKYKGDWENYKGRVRGKCDQWEDHKKNITIKSEEEYKNQLFALYEKYPRHPYVILRYYSFKKFEWRQAGDNIKIVRMLVHCKIEHQINEIINKAQSEQLSFYLQGMLSISLLPDDIDEASSDAYLKLEQALKSGFDYACLVLAKHYMELPEDTLQATPEQLAKTLTMLERSIENGFYYACADLIKLYIDYPLNLTDQERHDKIQQLLLIDNLDKRKNLIHYLNTLGVENNCILKSFCKGENETELKLDFIELPLRHHKLSSDDNQFKNVVSSSDPFFIKLSLLGFFSKLKNGMINKNISNEKKGEIVKDLINRYKMFKPSQVNHFLNEEDADKLIFERMDLPIKLKNQAKEIIKVVELFLLIDLLKEKLMSNSSVDEEYMKILNFTKDNYYLAKAICPSSFKYEVNINNKKFEVDPFLYVLAKNTESAGIAYDENYAVSICGAKFEKDLIKNTSFFIFSYLDVKLLSCGIERLIDLHQEKLDKDKKSIFREKVNEFCKVIYRVSQEIDPSSIASFYPCFSGNEEMIAALVIHKKQGGCNARPLELPQAINQILHLYALHPNTHFKENLKEFLEQNKERVKISTLLRLFIKEMASTPHSIEAKPEIQLYLQLFLELAWCKGYDLQGNKQALIPASEVSKGRVETASPQRLILNAEQASKPTPVPQAASKHQAPGLPLSTSHHLFPPHKDLQSHSTLPPNQKQAFQQELNDKLKVVAQRGGRGLFEGASTAPGTNPARGRGNP